MTDDTADEIERLTERCSAYKGQVEAGAAEIAALKARVAELEAAIDEMTKAQIVRLLTKIADLVDAEDACDPLDDAIRYANEALAICAAAPPPSTQKVSDHHEALLTFFRWAMNNGPFDGCSLDGGDVQDKAEHLGLIVPTKYDPKAHGERYEFDEGDDFYVFAPALTTNPGE